ncbi:FAD-binding oxidoreductase [Frondihabitans sp. VKM Ac-2883]|uniref:NAD(P)/FAD-dependent oxidoreductase n=1 Tax=Frondihabitans sp. VKM Ac-2883 TaxID=2783823 RepID=UPI00188A7981|nr:FAD-binding oxidoreductase [Frondihabitans sp. VKM Ac-2883]MBF4575682.1 FAD-binding oxidoreductase [Frondihabitans sp. VKM Ac-2883]
MAIDSTSVDPGVTPSGRDVGRGAVQVVGSGILGLSTAWHLHLAGFREITVVDAGPPLHGTTPAGAGFVLPAAADHNRRGGTAALPLAQYSLDFYRQLDLDGHDIEFGEHGNIVLATTEEFLVESVAGIVRHPLAAPGTRALSAADVGSLTGGAVDSREVVGGVLMPLAGQVTTSEVVRVLTAMLEAEGVVFRYETRVDTIETWEGRVARLITSAGDLAATTVVLAGGAWMNRLLDGVTSTLPLLPMVATRFVTADVGLPADMPTIQSRDLGPLWLRNLHGAFSWGAAPGYRSSRQLRAEGIDTSVTRGRPVVPSLIDAQLAHQATLERVFPALRGAESVTIMQGQPTWTADGRPYAGSAPGVEGLWVVGGDNEGGVMNGPGLGRLISDIVTAADRPSAEAPLADPEAFRLDRFAPGSFTTEEAIEAYIAADGDRVAHAFAK